MGTCRDGRCQTAQMDGLVGTVLLRIDPLLYSMLPPTPGTLIPRSLRVVLAEWDRWLAYPCG